MKIVVDTNIIFSGLLNSNGMIGDLLFNSRGIFKFYSCSYMYIEIERHWKKLKSISKLSDTQLNEARFKVFGKINFINEGLIPEKVWLSSERIVKDIDVYDIDFVALTNHLKGHLWTGDKELYNGLKKKSFNKVLNSTELFQIRKANQ